MGGRTPRRKSARQVLHQAAQGDIGARLDCLSMADVEDTLRTVQLPGNETSLLDRLQTSATDQADTLRNILEQMADHAEDHVVQMAIVWRYARQHQIWSRSTNPEYRTEDDFLNSLSGAQTIRICIQFGTSTDAARRGKINVIRRNWGETWYDLARERGLIQQNDRGAAGLSKRMLGQIACLSNVVDLTRALDVLESTMQKRRTIRSRGLLGLKAATAEHLLPGDLHEARRLFELEETPKVWRTPSKNALEAMHEDEILELKSSNGVSSLSPFGKSSCDLENSVVAKHQVQAKRKSRTWDNEQVRRSRLCRDAAETHHGEEYEGRENHGLEEQQGESEEDVDKTRKDQRNTRQPNEQHVSEESEDDSEAAEESHYYKPDKGGPSIPNGDWTPEVSTQNSTNDDGRKHAEKKRNILVNKYEASVRLSDKGSQDASPRRHPSIPSESVESRNIQLPSADRHEVSRGFARSSFTCAPITGSSSSGQRLSEMEIGIVAPEMPEASESSSACHATGSTQNATASKTPYRPTTVSDDSLDSVRSASRLSPDGDLRTRKNAESHPARLSYPNCKLCGGLCAICDIPGHFDEQQRRELSAFAHQAIFLEGKAPNEVARKWIRHLRFASWSVGLMQEECEVYVLSSESLLSQIKDGKVIDKPMIIRDNFTDAGEWSVDSYADILETFFSGLDVDVRWHMSPTPERMSVSEVVRICRTQSADQTHTNPPNMLNLPDLTGAAAPEYLRMGRFRLLSLLIERCKAETLSSIRNMDTRALLGKQAAITPFDMASCGRFNLLGWPGAFSGAHVDSSGATWTRNLCGYKLWMFVPASSMDSGDWVRLAEDGDRWDPSDKARAVVLCPGDVFVMRPGLVHAVLTLGSSEPCLMVGGIFWDDRDLLHSLKMQRWIAQNQNATNEPLAHQLAATVSALELIVNGNPGRFFATDNDLSEFREIMKDLQTLGCDCLPSDCDDQCKCAQVGRRCTPLCTAHTLTVTGSLPCMEESHIQAGEEADDTDLDGDYVEPA